MRETVSFKRLFSIIPIAAITLTLLAPATTNALPLSKDGGSREKTVCAGVSYKLTGTDGKQLSAEESQLMEKHLRTKCGKDKAPTPAIGQLGAKRGRSVAPMAHWTSYGYLAANLALSSGQMTYSTSASSMTDGMWKSLTCSIQRNYGAWEFCGSASG
jgi:hypothetical protein